MESTPYKGALAGDAGLSFNKEGVSFDNLDDAGKLVDRKYGHGSSVFKEVDDGFGGKTIEVVNVNRVNSILKQARNQIGVSDNIPIKWEISTELGAKGIRKLFKDNGINIEVIYLPQIKIINYYLLKGIRWFLFAFSFP